MTGTVRYEQVQTGRILLAAEILKGAVPCHPLRIKASDHMAFKGHLTIKG